MSVRRKIGLAKINEALWEVQHVHADMRRRHLYLFGDVEAEIIAKLMTALIQMNAESDAPIILFINSQGGSTYDSLAFYDALMVSRAPVTIVGLGSVMSAATVIFQASKRRLISKNTRFMVHDGSWDVGDAHAKVLISCGKEMKALSVHAHKLFAERSGQPEYKIRKLFEEESYLTAEETIAWGFADELYEGTL